MNRAGLCLAVAILAGSSPAQASPLVIQPGPMFYSATGLASVFAAPMLFCSDAYADPMRQFYTMFTRVDSLAEYAACWVPAMRANLVLVREEAASLPEIGSAATVALRLATMHLGPGFILNSCVGQTQWGVEAKLSPRRASTGTLTLHRTSEGGGTFDLQCSVYVAYGFQRYYLGYPADSFAVDVGPYVAQATNVEWTALPGPEGSWLVSCPACAENFFGSAATLAGVGNSLGDERDDSLRLQDSEFSLHLVPACVAPTAIQGNTWGGVKALYR